MPQCGGAAKVVLHVFVQNVFIQIYGNFFFF